MDEHPERSSLSPACSARSGTTSSRCARPEGGIGDRASLQPGRQDLDTLGFFDGGANNYYQDRKRYKPQFAATLSDFKDGWKGSHDLKLGFEWKRDRRHEGNDQPFDIFYRDRAGVPVEVDDLGGARAALAASVPLAGSCGEIEAKRTASDGRRSARTITGGALDLVRGFVGRADAPRQAPDGAG